MSDLEIDRLSPAQRPRGRVVMRPTWRDLLFLHWPIEAETLRPLLPSGLELDLFEGRAYIGLIPFTMQRVRPRFLPSPRPMFDWFENFHETNVRTYVHQSGQNPGVWFFSLDAANLPAVLAARGWFKLPYFWSRMSVARRADVIRYQSRRVWPQPKPAHCDISCAVEPISLAAPIGSLEHFLVERYVLYSESNGRLFRGRVHHKPYQLNAARVSHLEENLVASAGVSRPDDAPHACYSRGVQVEIFPLERVND